MAFLSHILFHKRLFNALNFHFNFILVNANSIVEKQFDTIEGVDARQEASNALSIGHRRMFRHSLAADPNDIAIKVLSSVRGYDKPNNCSAN
jgi:hypothetical protein